MDKEKWRGVIIGQMNVESELLGSFLTTIDILAEILEERDNIKREYENEGSSPLVEFTTDRGAVNKKPNPLLRQWQDLNVTALQYLRDLGLTAAGLRKLQGQLPKTPSVKGSKLFELMKEFE